MDDERNLKIIVCSKCGWRWGDRPKPLTKVYLDSNGWFVCPNMECRGRLVKLNSDDEKNIVGRTQTISFGAKQGEG